MLPQFPCKVTGYNASSVQFDCKERNLQVVPPGITSNATELDLSNNFIKTISNHSFSTLLNLTTLNLNLVNNKEKPMIDAKAFQHLTKLHNLRLTYNSLDQIPANLPGSLKVLELNNNKINSLTEKSVSGLGSVTHLWLSRNCYIWNPCSKPFRIANNTFVSMKNLQVLDLSFNDLGSVPRGLPQSLLTLKLGENKIQNINEGDFQGITNLQVLKIEGNCPRCQNAPYPCVPCTNFSLGIHPKAFHNLKELLILNLGGNSLTHLDPSWFKTLKNLKQLFLSFNFLLKPITGKADFLKQLPKLEKIDLSFNFDLAFYPSTINLSEDFSNLKALRTLHMEGLVFKGIGPHTLSPLFKLKNLTALNLGTNFIITLNASIFSNLSQLKMIYLAENRLYPAPVTNHQVDGSNQQLDPSHSPLIKYPGKEQNYEISHSLIKEECYESGRVLSLSSNNLFFITPKQFEGYGNIACLNLSRNGFSAALNGTEFSSLPNLTYLDLSFNKIDLAYDSAFNELKKLQVLDISHNAHYFQAYGITHNLHFLQNLPILRVLNMSHNAISTLTSKEMYSKSLAELQFTHNELGNLWKPRDTSYVTLFTNLTNLTTLDISYNKIKIIPDNIYEYLPRNLTALFLSNNLLKDFKWDRLRFLHQLRTLDLSFNKLTNVTGINVTNTLTFLDLSNNIIFHLDTGFLKGAKTLRALSLASNRLTTINQSTFQSTPENYIQTLFLQTNPFQCTCDLLDFILWIESSNVDIPWLTTEVKCGTPENRRGQPLIYFDINECVNDSLAFLVYILTSSFVIVFMFVTTVAHLFYWDASYVLHYMKAKLKGYSSLNSPDSVYDVFVTYDTKDSHVSEWVMRNLRVKLEEEGEKHLPLCLEERDWPPGVPLVDNLTQSIQYSRKTLFVLTEGYVKTGVFKLAMYLAHQRLLDENVDVIVLLLLEPVLQHSHFLRLRKRLCGRSVVEWPRTAMAEPWFWQNLRNVVRVDNEVMYNKTYSKYFTSN